jgi:hypothetical protein
MEFNVKNVAKRTRELRNQFGGSKNLAEVSGAPLQTVYTYCSEKSMEKRGGAGKKETWEKYFGKWDTEPGGTPDILEAKVSTPIVVTEEKREEPVTTDVKAEVKRSGIVISAGSLAELKELLNTIGYHMEFVAI